MWLEFADRLVNMLSPVLLALALRMVGLSGEGTWFMLQGISISSITITTVVMLWVIVWEMVPQAIFFVALASILIRIIMVYKNYMIIVLPLLDFMMHILSQLKMDEEERNFLDFIMHIWSQLKMDRGKRTEKSRVDGGRQLSMMSEQTMDQEEHIDKSRVDGQQLITSMTSRQMMDKREQIESSRVHEQHLTSMATQQTMNQEDQAESSRLDDQKIDKGEITRVDEQPLTSMTSNEIQIMEQEEQIEITPVGEQQCVLTRQQTTDQQEKIESSRIDEQHLTSTKSQERMDQGVTLFGVHKLGLAAILLYLQVVPGLPRTSHQYGALVRAGKFVVSLLTLYSQMQSSVWSHSRFAGTENYIISASVVITAYGMLLLISMSYIKIIIVPIAILIFIAALWNKLRLKSGRLKMDTGYYVKDVVSKRVEELLVLTALPYCALYFEAIFPTNTLALSHFLWFLSSSLGAVAVMIALLPVATSPGGAQVLQIFYRTCITVLTITVHTEAAEWAREDTALVFMPELVTVLVWFTIPFRLGVSDSDLSIHSGILRKSIVAVIFVVLGYTTSPAYQYRGRTRALRACSISGCLTYFSMCMLRQWPGSKPVSQVPVNLLEFFAKSCFIAAAVLAVMSATHGDFINYMLVDTGRAILLSVYLFLFLLLGPAENKRRFLRYIDPIVAAGRRFIHLSQRLHSTLIYLNRRLKQCAQWLGETSPDPSSGKFKTQ
jgi:hypothetical protein